MSKRKIIVLILYAVFVSIIGYSYLSNNHPIYGQNPDTKYLIGELIACTVLIFLAFDLIKKRELKKSEKKEDKKLNSKSDT